MHNKTVIDLTIDDDQEHNQMTLSEIGNRLERLPLANIRSEQSTPFSTLIDFCSKLETLPMFDSPSTKTTSRVDEGGKFRRRRKNVSDKEIESQKYPQLTDLVYKLETLPDMQCLERTDKKSTL